MIRLARLQPGKLYHVKQDKLALDHIAVEKSRYRDAGFKYSNRFNREDIFMYVESAELADFPDIREPHFWGKVYNHQPGEKVHHFLQGEKSYWLTSKSLKRLMEHWTAHGPIEGS